MDFKNYENNDLRKPICKLEAQLSAIKSYVNCEVSIVTNKIESISNDFEKRISTLQGKEKSKIEILQNMTEQNRTWPSYKMSYYLNMKS